MTTGDGHDPHGSPDITIEQDADAIRIHGLRPDPFRLRPRPTADVRTAVALFARDLERRRPLGLPVAAGDAQDFLSFAKVTAFHCLVRCTHDTYATLGDLENALAAATAGAAIRGAPLQVRVDDQRGEYFPWEFVGDRDRHGDVTAEARTTLGLATTMFRHPPGAADRQERFLVAEPLQLRFIRHADLAGVRVEKRFFQHSGKFRLLGPLPEGDGPVELARHLGDPRHDAPAGPDQVVHLACHHEAKKKPEQASAFELATLASTLSFGTGEKQEVTVGALDLELATMARRSTAGQDRPLVVFNACRGSFHPFASRSMVEVLLRNGNRGVVSTAVKVPDVAAAEFARFFYQRLLAGETAATALWLARWDLLTGRGSPLGLLYSYHGNPTLRAAPRGELPPDWVFPADVGGYR